MAIYRSNKAELDIANYHEVSDILLSDNLQYPMMPSSITVLSYNHAHTTTRPLGFI